MTSLLVFAKSPRVGFSKTRLAKDLGPTEALRINRFCHSRMIRAISHERWTPTLCIAPDQDINSTFGGLWPKNIQRKSQGRGNLGERLARAFRDAPPGPVLVIGTDIPDIKASLICHAIKRLKGHDAVIGPADDGGFWLFGASHAFRRRPLSFAPVRWSTRHAMQDLKATFPRDTRIAFIHNMIDLDDGKALSEWRKRNQ